MSKFIKDHSLSVGYNPITKQSFFDILKSYDRYIHSFFFSLTHGLVGNPYDPREVIKTLSKVDTYGIKGNILFNTYPSQDKWKEQLKSIIDLRIIESCTVLSLEIADEIKQKYPDLKIHLSVRYWDWHDDIDPHQLLSDNYELFKQYIDVVNISGYRSYNDHELNDEFHKMEIQTKFIANEGCVVRKNANYNNFSELKDITCMSQYQNCERVCDNVIFKKIPWLELCRVNLYKEQLQYMNYDIIKLSTRNKFFDDVLHMLNYWTSDNKTEYLPYAVYKKFNIKDHYEEYLQWIKTRSYCKCDCYTCRQCEKYYDVFKE